MAKPSARETCVMDGEPPGSITEPLTAVDAPNSEVESSDRPKLLMPSIGAKDSTT